MLEGERLYFNSVDHGVLKPTHLISNVPENPGAVKTKNKLINLAAINTKKNNVSLAPLCRATRLHLIVTGRDL